MRSRLRVLVSAYACEPDKGSEPAVGWNWVRQIARFHEVWVITRANNREPIEQALAKEPMPNVHWVYFDLPRWARSWKKGQRGIRLYYRLWQIGAYWVAKKLLRSVRLDLAHHVTFVNYWMPSFLPLLPLPFVWGPVGGGESAPRAFWWSFSLRGKIYELARDLARKLSELDPFLRLAARRAAIAFATTCETEKRLRALGCQRVTLLSQVALPEEEIEFLEGFVDRGSNPFRLLSIGNLLHLKGFELSLKAFGEFERGFPTSEYWVIGDGPERNRLERLARTLGVADKVAFWGALPRGQVLEKFAQCDVLVHPSLHDSGGSVCLEAMAAGRPVICLDLGGPALQVTDETGIKVPAISPEQAVTSLAQALSRLATDSALRVRLGTAGRQTVKDYFGWDEKGQFLATIYEEVKKARSPRSSEH